MNSFITGLFKICDLPPTFSQLPLNNRLWQHFSVSLPVGLKSVVRGILPRKSNQAKFHDVSMWVFSAHADQRTKSVRIFFALEIPPRTKPEPYGSKATGKFSVGKAIVAQV
jgi:hypothetical protein